METSSNKKERLIIKSATEKDCSLLLSLIEELAIFEKLADQVLNNEEYIRETFFGARVYAEAKIAYWEEAAAGMVIFFHNYSTFLGRPGLYIEDLFVREEFRGRGIGKALFLECARLARERNCGRMEWVVLNWNPAQDFYKKMGAYPLQEWSTYRLDRQAIENLIN